MNVRQPMGLMNVRHKMDLKALRQPRQKFWPRILTL